MAAEDTSKALETQDANVVISNLINDPVGYITAHQDTLITLCGNLVYALAILVVGWIIAKGFSGILTKVLNKAKVEKTIAAFAGHLVKYAILAFVITAVLGRLGIETASFIAIIGAASFAVGMALRDHYLILLQAYYC